MCGRSRGKSQPSTTTVSVVNAKFQLLIRPRQRAAFVAPENHRRVSRLAPISPFIVIASLYGADYHECRCPCGETQIKIPADVRR